MDRNEFFPRFHAWRVAMAACLLTVAACADGAPEFVPQDGEGGGMALWFASLTTNSCTATSNGGGAVPAGVDKIWLRWTEDGKVRSESIGAGAVKGSWLVKGLKVTDKLDVDVFGCTAAKVVAFSGRSTDLRIENKSETKARVFLAPVQQFACTGSTGGGATLQSPRSLAGAASLFKGEVDQAGKKVVVIATGDVLVAGGVKDWSKAKNLGTGSNATDLYDHRTGQFRKGPDLLVPRIQPHVHALDGRAVLVAGGLSTVSRTGQGPLPTQVLAPADVVAATPSIKAEVVTIVGETKSIQAVADVGVGARPFSQSLRVTYGAPGALTEEILFAGGVVTGGAPLAEATRLGNLADIAGGGKGVTTSIKLQAARGQPGLAAFRDGTVVVWGGTALAKDASGKKDPATMGEIVAPGAVAGELLVASGADVLGNAKVDTVAPAVVVLAETADVLTLLVAGGVPYDDPLSALDAPSYVVMVDRVKKTAECKPVSLSKGTLRAGVHTTAVRLPNGQVLLAGGLVSLVAAPGVDGCLAGAAECVLQSWFLLDPPADVAGSDVKLNVAATGSLGGPRFGVTSVPLPSGAMVLGGQASVFPPADPADVLESAGQIMTLLPADACK